MQLKLSFENDVEKAINDALDEADEEIVASLELAGRYAQNQARSANKIKDWKDQTGNLRSSIGYAVVRNGEVLRSSEFPSIRDAAEGTTEGKNYIRELASRIPTMLGDIMLVVVAGMHYASYVSDRGYDVLDSAEIIAEDILRKLEKSGNG